MPNQRLVRVSIALTMLGFLFVMLSQVHAKSARYQLLPTFTPMPTATIPSSAFSVIGASTYKSSDNALEILLPKAWAARPETQPGQYEFYFGDEQMPILTLQVQITTPAELISAAKPPTNAQEALQAIRNSFRGQIISAQLPANTTLTATVPVRIGKLSGLGYILTVPDESAQPGAVLDLRIADLPSGRIVFTFVQSSNAAWPRAKQLVDTMINSLVVRPNAIPTATPTSTPIPLERTAISLRNQLNTVEAKIQALTQTPSPTR